jgi:hypothetical protein
MTDGYWGEDKDPMRPEPQQLPPGFVLHQQHGLWSVLGHFGQYMVAPTDTPEQAVSDFYTNYGDRHDKDCCGG